METQSVTRSVRMGCDSYRCIEFRAWGLGLRVDSIGFRVEGLGVLRELVVPGSSARVSAGACTVHKCVFV